MQTKVVCACCGRIVCQGDDPATYVATCGECSGKKPQVVEPYSFICAECHLPTATALPPVDAACVHCGKYLARKGYKPHNGHQPGTAVVVDERAAWRTVLCRTCGAAENEYCSDKGGVRLIQPHSARVALAEKLPQLQFKEALDPTDKALIVLYSFVMLVDACAAKSQELFGKEFTSQAIQAHFAQEAIKELRKDGLLK